MTSYPRQVDREDLSCCSGGLDKIQMIDGGTLDLHQDLVACDRRHRNIAEHQLPTVLQHVDSFHASPPRVTGSLVLAPIWLRVEACPLGELRERTPGLTFQAR